MLKRLRQGSLGQEGSIDSQHNTVTSPSESVNGGASSQAPTQTSKPTLGQIGRGPSILGLLAAKRFTKNLRTKYGRSSSLYDSSRHSTSIHIQKEPSYRMEPKTKFKAEEVEHIIKNIVDDRIQGFKYHPKFCSNLCKLLSDEIKDGVKKLKYDRYKIVAVVHIGEKQDQSAFVASRCAWDKSCDDFATYTLETGTLFCTASVYGLYNE